MKNVHDGKTQIIDFWWTPKQNTTVQRLSMTSQQKALGRYRSINQQFSLKPISRDTRHIHSVVDNLKHNPQTLNKSIRSQYAQHPEQEFINGPSKSKSWHGMTWNNNDTAQHLFWWHDMVLARLAWHVKPCHDMAWHGTRPPWTRDQASNPYPLQTFYPRANALINVLHIHN